MSVRPDDWRECLTLAELARAARARVPASAWRYCRGGADAGRTLARNRRAFARYDLWYRVLVDVCRVETGVTLLGDRLATPILIAPTAYQRLQHPDGELATARAAAAAGAVYIVSTLATASLEAVAAAAPGPRWFQLYVHRDRGLTRSLVERARAAGYRALVLTVDTPVLGRRLADVRHGFTLPPGLEMANLAGSFEGVDLAGATLMQHVAARHEPGLTWKDLEWLSGLSDLPIVLKGIVRADDAARAVTAGAAAIIVSNHGGRQLDGAPATLDALPGVVAAVSGRCPVLLDGGVRWGTDVLKALGLGAAAVCVGRPVLWGLACGGEEGVARVLALLREELERAMALSGCPDLASLPSDLVRPG
jgi:4-hydroxymandelate oxidase